MGCGETNVQCTVIYVRRALLGSPYGMALQSFGLIYSNALQSCVETGGLLYNLKYCMAIGLEPATRLIHLEWLAILFELLYYII